MLHHEPPQLAIYDESYACAQAFHFSFKKIGFTVHELSCNENELLRFLLLKPTVLLFRIDSSMEKAYNILAQIRGQNSKLKILVHTARKGKEYSGNLIKSGANSIVTGEYDFKTLIEKLVKLEGAFAIYAEGLIDIEVSLKSNSIDPFYQIAHDPKKLLITRLLAGGHFTKDIANALDSTETEIEAFRKKILHETHCHTMAEYIGKAKDMKII